MNIDIEKICSLAKLEFPVSERETLKKEMDDIIDFADKLGRDENKGE